MSRDEILSKHSFVFNDHDNGGEQLSLLTSFIANGDPKGVYIIQELRLNSYGNATVLHLLGASFTPELLRELANQLDVEMANAKSLTKHKISA